MNTGFHRKRRSFNLNFSSAYFPGRIMSRKMPVSQCQKAAISASGEATACGKYEIIRERRPDDLESDRHSRDWHGHGDRGEPQNIDGTDQARGGETGFLLHTVPPGHRSLTDF